MPELLGKLDYEYYQAQEQPNIERHQQPAAIEKHHFNTMLK
jgi:hypothetical protein